MLSFDLPFLNHILFDRCLVCAIPRDHDLLCVAYLCVSFSIVPARYETSMSRCSFAWMSWLIFASDILSWACMTRPSLLVMPVLRDYLLDHPLVSRTFEVVSPSSWNIAELFGVDLWTLLEQNSRRFCTDTRMLQLWWHTRAQLPRSLLHPEWLHCKSR